MQKIEEIDKYINIIGIKDEGKKLVESIDLHDFDSIVDEAYCHVSLIDERGFISSRRTSSNEALPSSKSEWRFINHINKYYFNNNNISVNNKEYASILVYDHKDIDYVKSIINDINDDDTFILIGLCINGNEKIEGINSINVSDKDIIDTIKHFIGIVMQHPTLIDFSIEDLNDYLDNDNILNGFIIKADSIDELLDETKKDLEIRFKDKKVLDVFPFLMTYDYTLSGTHYIFEEVRKIINDDRNHWCYADNDFSKKEDSLLVIVKE